MEITSLEMWCTQQYCTTFNSTTHLLCYNSLIFILYSRCSNYADHVTYDQSNSN